MNFITYAKNRPKEVVNDFNENLTTIMQTVSFTSLGLLLVGNVADNCHGVKTEEVRHFTQNGKDGVVIQGDTAYFNKPRQPGHK